MKITRRDLKVILLLVGILSAFLAYQMYFSKKLDEIEAEQNKQAQLEKEIKELQQKKDQEPKLKADMATWEKEILEKLNEFPVYQKYEDGILYLRHLEEEFDIYFGKYTILEASAVQNVTGKVNGKDYATQLLAANTNTTYVTTYEDFKELVDYIYADENVTRVINNVTMTFDRTTGQLSGNLVMDAYAMIGGDRVYEDVEIPGYDELYEEDFEYETDPDTGETISMIGVENIFGTIETTEAVETDEYGNVIEPEEE